MNTLERRFERLLSALVIAVAVTFWVIAFAAGEPPEFEVMYYYSAIAVAVVALPWVIAVRLLWRAWWAQNSLDVAERDGPARLLSAAVSMLPDQRRDWGAAMTAELTQVAGRSARWSFAAGCARTAFFPPRAVGVPVAFIAMFTFVSLLAVGLSLEHMLPAMRCFAIVFIALVSLLAVFIAGRGETLRRLLPGPSIAAAGVAGVAASIAATAVFLLKNPAAAEYFSPMSATFLALFLVGSLWLTLAPPRALTTRRSAGSFGIGGALFYGTGFMYFSRAAVHTYGGPVVWMLFAPCVIFSCVAATAAAADRSLRAGIQAALWTTILGTLLVFAIWLPESMHRYALDGRTLADGESGYPIGVNLAGAIWCLFQIPVFGLPFGVFGAVIGRRWPCRSLGPVAWIGGTSMLTMCMALGFVFALQSAATELLPAPTGPHKTGRASFHWKDDARDEIETSAPGDKRELMVHLFYPADTNAGGELAAYVPDAEAMSPPWNSDQVARITAMRAHSIENAPLPASEARYPVVVFAPGGGMKGLTYHVLCADLASHGWVVAAMDPPYNARAVRFPDGRVLGNLQPSERGWPQPTNPEERVRFYQERVVHWCRDISFVIDQLAALDRGNGPFARRLDLARGVGVFGHSRGGQAAVAVRLLDERVRGGINLDGTAGDDAVLPVKGEGQVGDQPFLWIQGPLPPPPSEQQLRRSGRGRADYDAEINRITANWRRQLDAISGGAIHVTIERPGIEHIDFSDEPFWDGRMTAGSRPGKLQTITDTRAWVRAFFDGTVRGEWAALKELAGEDRQPQPNVTVHVFGQIWQ